MAPPADGELWHPSVRKLLLSRCGHGATPAATEPLGVLYLDLFPRPRKTTQAGLYTLRSARRGVLSPAATAATAAAAAATADDDDQHPALLRHLPACVLVCSLPEPRGAGCDPTTGLAFLQHQQLER